MRGKLTLTSLILLGSITVAGCSCGKNGEYHFSHLEYTVDGKTEKTDCVDTSELPGTVKSTCDLINLTNAKESILIRIEDNKLYYHDSETPLFFKIEKKHILTSEEENGTYADSGMTYKNGKIISNFGGIAYVYKK